MICFRRSIQLGGPGYGSYWGRMDAQRSSQLWSRLYIPQWWRMLVLEGKSRNRSVWSQARLCSRPHAFLHLPTSNTRRGFPRHGWWRLQSVHTERCSIQRCTLRSEDQDYTDTDERAAIRRWQCTGCPLCWRDAENSGCFLRCVKEVRPED